MSQTNHIIVKQSGSSPPFRIDVIGELNRRYLYDKKEKGFTFLDSSNKVYYYKKSSSNADWSKGIPFVGSLSNTFKEGIEIGDYEKEVSGAKIDKDGNGEFRNLFLDTLFIKNELTGTYETVEEAIKRINRDTLLGDGNLRMEITSSEGNVFIGDDFTTELKAKVLVYWNDVTNNVEEWEWTRQSGYTYNDIINDLHWNTKEARDNKSLTITVDDIPTESVKFLCTAKIDNKYIKHYITI